MKLRILSALVFSFLLSSVSHAAFTDVWTFLNRKGQKTYLVEAHTSRNQDYVKMSGLYFVSEDKKTIVFRPGKYDGFIGWRLEEGGSVGGYHNAPSQDGEYVDQRPYFKNEGGEKFRLDSVKLNKEGLAKFENEIPMKNPDDQLENLKLFLDLVLAPASEKVDPLDCF